MTLSSLVDARLAEVPAGQRRLDLDIGARLFASSLAEFVGEVAALPASRRPAAMHGMVPFLEAGVHVAADASEVPAYRPLAALLSSFIAGVVALPGEVTDGR